MRPSLAVENHWTRILISYSETLVFHPRDLGGRRSNIKRYLEHLIKKMLHRIGSILKRAGLPGPKRPKWATSCLKKGKFY